jgi:hypothetical protein
MSGAGLTSVMSCAAAEVISSPADCMAGCMRDASDSRLKVDSGEGKLNELAVMSASICWIDDCIMLARFFNSAKASCEALGRRALSNTLNVDNILVTYLAVEGWMEGIADCEEKGVGSETDKDIVDDQKSSSTEGYIYSNCVRLVISDPNGQLNTVQISSQKLDSRVV